MRKKVIAGFGTMILVSALVSSIAFAGSSANNVNGYRLAVDCSNTVSNHSVTPLKGQTYPIGKGYVYYTTAGNTKSASTGGSSYSSYWTGRIQPSGSSVHIYEARTTGYGGTVTTYN